MACDAIRDVNSGGAGTCRPLPDFGVLQTGITYSEDCHIPVSISICKINVKKNFSLKQFSLNFSLKHSVRAT